MLRVRRVVAVEGHGDVQLLRLGPQGVVVPVVEGPLVDHVGGQHERDRAQRADGEARLRHRQVDVLKGHQRRGLEAIGVLAAEVPHPAVPRAAHGRRERRLQPVDVDGVGRPRPEQDPDVDALDVHRLQHGRGRRAPADALPRRRACPERPCPVALGAARVGREDLVVHVGAHLPVAERQRLDAASKFRLEVALPEVLGLDHVEVAVHDPESLLRHPRLLPPGIMPRLQPAGRGRRRNTSPRPLRHA
jgi:hypothetical protein